MNLITLSNCPTIWNYSRNIYVKKTLKFTNDWYLKKSWILRFYESGYITIWYYHIFFCLYHTFWFKAKNLFNPNAKKYFRFCIVQHVLLLVKRKNFILPSQFNPFMQWVGIKYFYTRISSGSSYFKGAPHCQLTTSAKHRVHPSSQRSQLKQGYK